jgi:hypothetical protein
MTWIEGSRALTAWMNSGLSCFSNLSAQVEQGIRKAILMALVVLEEPPLLLFAPQAAKAIDKNSATLSKRKRNFVDTCIVLPHFPL